MPNCDPIPLDLIHPHWINKFHLDSLEGEVKTVPARSLLGPLRFGIFSKMVYIRYRDSRPCLARRVYRESMRCSNPFWKEYGKEDEKYNIRIFLKDFNRLIDSFSVVEFDPNESIVPVGGESHILDGEHRISALSFYDKDVTICEFPDAEMPCLDYSFYKDRWMSDYCMDVVAYESVPLIKGLRVLCLWPGEDVDSSTLGEVFYSRSFRTGYKAYSRLRSALDPLWVGEAVKGETRFVFYLPSEADYAPEDSGESKLVSEPDEVLRVSNIVLTCGGRKNWWHGGGIACGIITPIEVLWDKVSVGCRFIWFRFKSIFANWDNNVWISFYNFINPLWKRHDKLES